MTPSEPQPDSPAPPDAAPAALPAPPRARRSWRRKLMAVLFATICLEIGCYLAVFPWTSSTIDFTAFHPHWRHYLDSLSIRCAVSGLGLVNLYIAVVEILRLRRFAGR
jgi:hypothetical protein